MKTLFKNANLINENGDIFTVYYGRLPDDEKTSVLWTRWKLV